MAEVGGTLMFRAYAQARDEHLAHFTDQLKERFRRHMDYRSVELTLRLLRDSASSQEEKDCADAAYEATIEARGACR